jgi:AcrR family transcriptional regulator
VNIALVSYYFGDKLELYSEVLRQLARHTPAIRTTLEQDAPAEAILREVIKIRLLSACVGERPGWDVRILCHEIARPSPAMTRMINEISRPIYDRFRQLIGKILQLPPHAEDTVLSTHSVAGQIFFYVLASPILARLSPELKMTPEKVDRIADHIADFSLAYLRRHGPANAAGQQRSGHR